jgi:hypothetical protein
VTSGERVSVARCHYCGREFDVRRFQVRVVGRRRIYDSTDCAELDGADDLRRRPMRHGDPRGQMK